MKKLLFILSSVISLTYANECINIDTKAKEIMSKNQINGIAIAIINNNKVEYCNYGYTDKIKKAPITNKSIFEIASVTKTFTAQMASIAASNNKLDLDASVTKYIPELAANESYIKINNKELLSHVAGLPFKYKDTFTESELLATAIQNKPTHSPESYYQYSNLSITLASISLTKIYHTNYENLLKKLVLNPLGMKYTSMHVSPKNQNLIVTGYGKDNNPAKLMTMGITRSAAGLKSNTYDLAKYLQFHMNEENSQSKNVLEIVHKNYYCLYKDGTYQQLTWEYHPMNALSEEFLPNANYANMLEPREIQSTCKTTENGFIDKTGNSPGMSSYIGYIKDRGVGVVILSSRGYQPDVVNLGRYILKTTSNQSKPHI